MGVNDDEVSGNKMGVEGRITIPKIKNGSVISVGKSHSIKITTDHHFNCFQKKMIKWCFGFIVEDYSKGDEY